MYTVTVLMLDFYPMTSSAMEGGRRNSSLYPRTVSTLSYASLAAREPSSHPVESFGTKARVESHPAPGKR